MAAMTSLDLTQDVASLTASLVDIESVSGNEQSIADAVEAALRPLGHLDVSRHGDTIVARTHLGLAERVAIAGHLDTVPLSDNLPSRVDADNLYGLGSCDMKGGVAIALKLAASITAPNREVTYVFYECEEVEAVRNGLGRLARVRPGAARGRFRRADGAVQRPGRGRLPGHYADRVIVVPGVRAHSARWWMGVNAIHGAGEVIERLLDVRPALTGGGWSEVSRRPERSRDQRWRRRERAAGRVPRLGQLPVRAEPDQRTRHWSICASFSTASTSSSSTRLPGRCRAWIGRRRPRSCKRSAGRSNPKFGWTDVARFSVLGVPAVNFGPGDPQLAHSRDEYVPLSHLRSCEEQMTTWLTD